MNIYIIFLLFSFSQTHSISYKTKNACNRNWLHAFFAMVVPGRIELPTQGFSVLCSTDWATGPLVAREGFEPTTSGLWARRATRLLYLAIRYFLRKAEELGFEPRRRLPDLPVFKTGPFNHLGIPPCKWTLKDSNLRPVGYEPTALTNWAKGPSLSFSQKLW